MPRVRANGLEIEYEETGSPDHPMILLVSGYMGQMTEWPDRFKQALADAGRRVVLPGRWDERPFRTLPGYLLPDTIIT